MNSSTFGRAKWWHGARPRTWGAAFAPVIAGSAIGASEGAFNFGFAILALVVALSLQIGVNYANDYSDGVRGTDAKRVGPVRLVGQGLASPRSVKHAAWIAFLVGALAGVWLSAASGHLWLVAAGAVAILAAWFYTGGKHPYGYFGLGELIAFVFFGPVAVIGTSYAQTGLVTPLAIWAGVAIGLFAAALLLVNNIRDIRTDIQTGKRTIAVRLGQQRATWVYRLCLLVAFSCLVPMSLETSAAIYLAAIAIAPALRANSLLLKPAALPLTSISELLYAIGLAAGLVISL